MMRPFTSGLFILAMLIALTVPASANKRLVQDFKAKYAATKYLEKNHGCMLCHADVKKHPKELTAYGKDFKAQKGKPAEKFAKIEKLDSDKDGFSNIAEIKAGTSPADPKVSPKTVARNAATTGTLTATQATTGTAAMHPAKAQKPAAKAKAGK
jgi:hypothetical protein